MTEQLSPEEIQDLIETAVDDAEDAAIDKKVTMPGLVIFMSRYEVNNDKHRKVALDMLKARGIRVVSGEGHGCSGRLNNKGMR